MTIGRTPSRWRTGWIPAAPRAGRPGARSSNCRARAVPVDLADAGRASGSSADRQAGRPVGLARGGRSGAKTIGGSAAPSWKATAAGGAAGGAVPVPVALALALAISRAATCLQLRFIGQVHTPDARATVPAELTVNDTVTEYGAGFVPLTSPKSW